MIRETVRHLVRRSVRILSYVHCSSISYFLNSGLILIGSSSRGSFPVPSVYFILFLVEHRNTKSEDNFNVFYCV